MLNATIGAEELTVISSYQTLPADKTKKVINQSQSSKKSGRISATIVVKLLTGQT
jgi:hypothetical protein